MLTWTLLDLFPAVEVAAGVAACLFALVTYRWPAVGAALALVALGLLGGVYLLAMLGQLRTTPDDLVAQLKGLVDPRIIQAAGIGAACYVVPLFIYLRGKDKGASESHADSRSEGYREGYREGYEKAQRESRQAT